MRHLFDSILYVCRGVPGRLKRFDVASRCRSNVPRKTINFPPSFSTFTPCGTAHRLNFINVDHNVRSQQGSSGHLWVIDRREKPTQSLWFLNSNSSCFYFQLGSKKDKKKHGIDHIEGSMPFTTIKLSHVCSLGDPCISIHAWNHVQGEKKDFRIHWIGPLRGNLQRKPNMEGCEQKTWFPVT